MGDGPLTTWAIMLARFWFCRPGQEHSAEIQVQLFGMYLYTFTLRTIS